MLLPGGLLRGGEVRRRVRWREPDGYLELRIAEAPRVAGSFHAGVSRVLSALVEAIDDEPLDDAAAQALCVVDRQFLMQRAATRFGIAQQWIATSCRACRAPFELEVDLAALPVGEAGPGFPFVAVETEAGPLQLRVPTGSDEIAIAALDDGADAEHALLRRLVVQGDLPPVLSVEAVAWIEGALEQVSPWVVTELAATCPACGATHPEALDPYVVMRRSASELLDDTHTIAWHYHWSEAEILALPRERRQAYLARIDRARGLTS